MAEHGEKKNVLIYLALSLVGAPFVITLVNLFKKGPDAPVTMQDLFAIFGVQVLIATLLLIYLVFFHNASAVLG